MTTRDTRTELQDSLAAARSGFVAAGFFSFFLNLLYLVSPLYMLQVYDRVLASGSRATLLYLTLMAIGALAVFGVLEGVRTATLARMGAWLNARLGGPALRAGMLAGIARGGSRAETLRDTQQLQNFIGGPSVIPFFDAPWAPFFIALIWILHPWLGQLALGTGLVLLLISLANEKATRKPQGAANRSTALATADADRIVRHAETVQAMGMLPALEERWRAHNRTALDNQVRAAEITGWLQGLSRFVRMGAQVGVLGLGAFIVLNGDMSAGSMIASSILLGRAMAPIEQSIGAWRSFVSVRASYHRLNETLAAHPAVEEPTELPAPAGALRVEGLYVRAPGSEKLLLKNLGFEAGPGTAVAIIGPSAAGKSTLCRALSGTLPLFHGSIRLDGAELANWPGAQLGRAIGYLPQTVELFDGTVRENIARMSAADAADVIAAAKMAEIHDMVLQLPEAYETRIGPSGLKLSGGQSQRIGLARAAFGDPKLVILDEPNAHLDQAGEMALVRTIARLKASGAAVLVVAHRQSILAAIDRILVMNDGVIETYGARDEVLQALAERQRGLGLPAGSAQEVATRS